VTPRGVDSAGKAGSEKDDPALAAAVDFLMNLPEPWPLGRVSAKAMAPLLIEAITEQGWRLDADLIAKLTENAAGVHRPMSVLRIRISDLPKAPQRTATKSGSNLPLWCGDCGDGNPAAEFNAKFRTEPSSKKPCPACHPAHRTADAA
jgi:hypothetical protein